MNSIFMKDVNDTKAKMFRLQWGVAASDERVTEKVEVVPPTQMKLKRPESLQRV